MEREAEPAEPVDSAAGAVIPCRMRITPSTLTLSLALITLTLALDVALAAPAPDAVTVVAQRRTVARKGSEKKDPIKISYPLVKGITAPAVAAKIEAILKSKTRPAQLGKDDDWLDEVGFKVNHNARGILDLDIFLSGTAAYPSGNTEHYVLDVRTGVRLGAKEVLKPASMAALAARLDRLLQAELKKARKGECAEVEMSGSFGVKELDQLEVGAQGLTFRYELDLPHAVQACAPPGRYLIRWAELRPHLLEKGPLAELAR